MSVPAVLVAVRKKLADTSGLPGIIWPNEAADIAPPFLAFSNGPMAGEAVTLDGHERFLFRPVVSVMVAANTFTAAADGYVTAIQAAFKINTRLFTPAGVEIGRCDRTPEPDGGGPDGNLWRVNLTLRVSSHQRL